MTALNAGPFRLIRPMTDSPPVVVDGSTATDAKATGTIVKVTCLLTAPSEAAIVAVALDPTPEVATVNIPEVAFSGTYTLAGTVAKAELLVNPTKIPLIGAGPFSVTVPWVEDPPVKVVAFSPTLVNEGGSIVSVVVTISFSRNALSVTSVGLGAVSGTIENWPDVAPAGMNTYGGGLTSASPEAN